MKLLLLLAALAACDARAHVATCADDLGGEWADEHDARWALLDTGRVEGYPLFADHPAGRAPGVTTAPRALDLARAGSGLAGTIARRYELGAHACVTTVEAHVVACANDTLELVLGDPPEPAFVDEAHCAAGRGFTHRERWHRVR